MTERRSLLDDDATPTREMDNIFGDEFEVDDFDVVADGFRPSGHDGEGSVGHDEVEEQPIRTVSAHYASNPVTPSAHTGTLRNSMRKSRGASENPFVSPEDDGEGTPSLSFEPDMVHRSVSSASSRNFVGASSPRFGAGPSHPYGMYPQGTIPRSPSVTTSSTIRPLQRQSSIRNGPQHPYTMYPQGVDEDIDDEDDALVQSSVPVGFPGLGHSYQRRLGPDGEEQDIIGEDGHTEQLPPYTRYPEDAPEKMPLLEVPAAPAAPTALHSRAPVAGTDPTMDLMHNTIIPQSTPTPQSMTDGSALTRQSTARSARSLESHQNSTASNKSWSEKSWKEKRKTRFCGIPFGWLLLSVSVLAIIAIISGGVIGWFVEHQGNRAHGLQATSLYDASAIATPVSLAPPTGTYALSMSTPQETQASCLTQADQQAAWTCNLAGDMSAASIYVGVPPGGNESGAYIFYDSDDQHIYYGAQLSWMQSPFSKFITVSDNDNPNNGPAYYFSQFYDKLVVIPEDAIDLSASSNNKNEKVKRQGIQLDQGWFQKKRTAQPGEKPWFCVWNNTFVEGFVYVQQPVAPSYSLSTASSDSTISSTPALTSSSAGSTAVTSSSTTPLMTTTTLTGATSTATFTGLASAASVWASHVMAQPTDSDSDSDHDDKYHDKRQDDSSEQLPLYPYVVKIEERRVSGNTVLPYCQQYQILDDGSYNWVPQADGSRTIVQLDESDPGYGAYQSAGLAGSTRKLREKRLVPGGCHCQWTSGQSG